MRCTALRRRRLSRPAPTNWWNRPRRRKCRASSTAPARARDRISKASAPSRRAVDAGKPKPWLWIAAAVVLGVVLAVAGAAILMRQKPQDLAIKPPVEATGASAPQPPAKIAERVEATPATPAAPAAAASEPKADQSAAQGAAPANPAAATQSPPAAPAAPAPSAGRAAMLVASADNPQKPVVSLGSTVWSLIPAGARPAGDCRGQG